MMLTCQHCGHLEPNVSDEAVSVICGKCVQLIAMGKLREEQSYLEKFASEDCKAFRKSRGWTQEVLAQKARIPSSRVATFERGQALCPPEVAALMEVAQ